MLLAFNETEIKECMKDIEVKRFGDRFKIVRQITVMKKVQQSEKIPADDIIDENQTIEDSEEVDTERLLAEPLDEITDCELCKHATQHVCRRCGELYIRIQNDVTLIKCLSVIIVKEFMNLQKN